MKEFESPLGTVKFTVKVTAEKEVTFDEIIASVPKTGAVPAVTPYLCIDLAALDHDQALALTKFISQTGIVGTLKMYLGGTDFDGPLTKP